MILAEAVMERMKRYSTALAREGTRVPSCHGSCCTKVAKGKLGDLMAGTELGWEMAKEDRAVVPRASEAIGVTVVVRSEAVFGGTCGLHILETKRRAAEEVLEGGG